MGTQLDIESQVDPNQPELDASPCSMNPSGAALLRRRSRLLGHGRRVELVDGRRRPLRELGQAA